MDIIEKYLKERYEFKYNEILNRTFFRARSKNSEFKLLKGYEFNSLYRELKNHNYTISVQGLKCLLESDFVKKYNPFKEYFCALPKWDGETDYIEQLSSTIETTDDKLFKWAFKKWLVAFVACAIDKDNTNHCVLIFTGKQGIGKTTWLLNLVPEMLKEYAYSGNIKPGNKDSTLLLSERLLINMDELTSYTKNQVESFKELITKDCVSERRAYGQFTENYVRRASFVGSSNHNQILMDVSGNRRFLVFETLHIDYSLKLDLDLVYSQAMSLFYGGFKFYFDRDDIQSIEDNNEQYKQVSIEEEYLDKYFRIPSVKEQASIVQLNATEIIEYMKSQISSYFNFSAITIGKLMKSKGYQTKKVNGISKYQVILNQ